MSIVFFIVIPARASSQTVLVFILKENYKSLSNTLVSVMNMLLFDKM
jgi:hypothetical protein